ncbi:FHIP family protein GG24907 isoform X1 [Anastrepha ludens]|uniref:FHIP family protein GG24907 isoform X1 n=1 Tax=Anastrepha ludens TaxID=28586 RepID=UPI0023B1D0A5|nr:FHIP family protein GG24907 isoform X1 [Anastrepha ludens]
MSWLRSSPLRQSLTRSSGNSAPFFASLNRDNNAGSSSTANALRQRPIDAAMDCDPRACYDSFCKHWQQAYDIIQRSEPPQRPPSHDDVLGVVSHLDFMVTLLLVELHHCNKVSIPTADAAPPPAPCLEYMLSENLLDKLYEWGCTTGRYANAVRLEQLKLYELLVSHSRHQLLCHEPFLRPLLKILASSQGEIFPPDLEKRLVILLNQLCVVLMQNVHLLDLFFFSAAQEQHKQTSSGYGEELQRSSSSSSSTNFIIFSLLIPYVHREGSVGHQARDALLLCMALSQKNSNVGTYIAQYSSMCPLLVTGLGGLYSRLPNSIEITSVDWHRITPDDVTEIPELTLFMNALEFCNAVVQVAHEMIKSQLLDFLYHGFIVPVLGPAVLQTLKGKHFQTNVESQISAMSYLDLILRSITEPGLLRAFVKFLLDTEKFDGERILDTLIDRLGSTDANLCMVTMALFDTLLSLHCEDLMLELLLKYILPGKHVPISHRHKINRIDPYINTAEFFLDLTPDAMKRARELTKHKSLGDTVTTQPSHPALPSPTSTMSKTIGANWNYYGLHTGNSLYANFHAYLFEAHCRITQCKNACSKWANTYKYQKWPTRNARAQHAQLLEMVKQFFNEFSVNALSDATQAFESSNAVTNARVMMEKTQPDSLQSIGESSGYESFKWRPVDEDGGECNDSAANAAMHLANSSAAEASELDNSGSSSNSNSLTGKQYRKEVWRVSSNTNDIVLTDLDFSEDLFAQGTVSLGPFLNAIWGKLQTFTSNSLYVNLHLTGLITHLACYPLPLVHSILLRPDIVITSDTPSFHQMLRILKQQIDAELPMCEDSLEIVDVARSYLIDREFRLINARKATDNSPVHIAKNALPQQLKRFSQQTTFGNISSATPIQVTPSSSYDPFKRNDNKRKSISKSITSMFSRKASASSGLSQIYAFFTGGSLGSSFSSNGNGSTSQQQGATNPHSTRETSLTTMASTANPFEQPTAGTQTTHSSQTLGGATTSASGMANNNSTHNTQHTHTYTHHNNSIGSSTMLVTSSGAGSEPVSLDSLSSMGAIASTSGTERTRDLALCAVLLDEWLKELAAIAQEQSVVLINDNL